MWKHVLSSPQSQNTDGQSLWSSVANPATVTADPQQSKASKETHKPAPENSVIWLKVGIPTFYSTSLDGIWVYKAAVCSGLLFSHYPFFLSCNKKKQNDGVQCLLYAN